MRTFKIAIGGHMGIDKIRKVETVSAHAAREIAKKYLERGQQIWYVAEMKRSEEYAGTQDHNCGKAKKDYSGKP